jgi:hypothetical protein
MDNPEKLAAYGRQDEEKRKQNMCWSDVNDCRVFGE